MENRHDISSTKKIKNWKTLDQDFQNWHSAFDEDLFQVVEKKRF